MSDESNSQEEETILRTQMRNPNRYISFIDKIKKLDEKFDLTSEWAGNTLHFHRPGVNGHLAVTDHDMKLNVTLGFLLKMMKGPIEKAIHEQLGNVLDAAPVEAASSKAPKAAAPAGAKKPAARKK